MPFENILISFQGYRVAWGGGRFYQFFNIQNIFMYDRSILVASVLAVILKGYMHRGDICTMEFQKGRNRNSN